MAKVVKCITINPEVHDELEQIKNETNISFSRLVEISINRLVNDVREKGIEVLMNKKTDPEKLF